MAAVPESIASPSSTMQSQISTPATPDRRPTLSDAATDSQPSQSEDQDGTPPGGISILYIKTVQSILEVSGYRARRDLPIRTWAIRRFISSVTLTVLQITAIGALARVASVRGEDDACPWLNTSNIVWGGKLALLQLYPDIWFLRKRLKTRVEPVQGVPVVRVCPPDHATFMNLLTFVDAFVVAVWILVQVVVFVVHGKQCYTRAPLLSTLAIVLLALAVLYYFPTTLLLILRRSREPRSDGGDDIEIGPLPQSKVDRIDLVYYIPPPAPTPVAPAATATRPSGPVAGLRRFGLTSWGLRGTSNQGPHHNNNGEWEKTFKRMPRAFLRIEKHEAQCAICLDEYTAPPRVAGAGAIPGSAGSASAVADAQGVPEPLRWLDCGHVFHKRCVDPYITREAARCPTCRAPVKVLSKGRK